MLGICSPLSIKHLTEIYDLTKNIFQRKLKEKRKTNRYCSIIAYKSLSKLGNKGFYCFLQIITCFNGASKSEENLCAKTTFYEIVKIWKMELNFDLRLISFQYLFRYALLNLLITFWKVLSLYFVLFDQFFDQSNQSPLSMLFILCFKNMFKYLVRRRQFFMDFRLLVRLRKHKRYWLDKIQSFVSGSLTTQIQFDISFN